MIKVHAYVVDYEWVNAGELRGATIRKVGIDSIERVGGGTLASLVARAIVMHLVGHW